MPAAPKLYRAIIEALRADIAAGSYRPGDRLPPERELVERFDVSRLTVRRHCPQDPFVGRNRGVEIAQVVLTNASEFE